MTFNKVSNVRKTRKMNRTKQVCTHFPPLLVEIENNTPYLSVTEHEESDCLDLPQYGSKLAISTVSPTPL